MILRYLILFVFVFRGLIAFSQLSSGADFSEAAQYSENDLVFVFCSDNQSNISLTATDSTNTGGFDFKWYKYNETTLGFTDQITDGNINADSTQSNINNITQGGYKVVLSKAGNVQEYVAWIYMNTERSAQLRFDDDPDVCNYLGIWVDPVYATTTFFNTSFAYYDTASGQSYILRNKIQTYEWSSTPSWDSFRSYNGPFTSIGEDPSDNDAELPTENTTFSVVVTDRFGCSVEDEIEYTAIETDAKFDFELIDYKTGNFIESGNSDGSVLADAPAMFRFTNQSINATEFTWIFGDTIVDRNNDTIRTEDFYLQPEHTYYRVYPTDTGRTYTMKLYSENQYGCIDSVLFKIKMNESKLELPNVFTPNDDGVNEVFIIDSLNYRSIRSFKITIFTRTGQLVHEFEGDIRDWEGWDGKIRNTNRLASPGTYFYVLEAYGWDDVKYDNKSFKSSSANDTDTGGDGANTGTSGKPVFGIIRIFDDRR